MHDGTEDHRAGLCKAVVDTLNVPSGRASWWGMLLGVLGAAAAHGRESDAAHLRESE